MCHHADVFDGAGHQPGQIHLFPLILQAGIFGGVGAGEEQQVGDVFAQLHGHFDDAPQDFFVFANVAVAAAQGHFGLAPDDGNGSAQFVADIGEEFPPRLVHALEFGVQLVQFMGALGDFPFQHGASLAQFSLLDFQFLRHLIEVDSQVAKFVTGVECDAVGQVAGGDFVGALQQGFDGFFDPAHQHGD